MQEVWQNKKLAETRAELLCSPHSTPMHRDSPPPLTSQPVLRSRRSQSLNASHGYVHVQGGHLATVVDIVTRRAPARDCILKIKFCRLHFSGPRKVTTLHGPTR